MLEKGGSEDGEDLCGSHDGVSLSCEEAGRVGCDRVRVSGLVIPFACVLPIRRPSFAFPTIRKCRGEDTETP